MTPSLSFAVQATTSLTLLDVDFRSTEVRLEGGGLFASVHTTARVRAFRGTERYEEGDRHVRFGFTKTDGDWKKGESPT